MDEKHNKCYLNPHIKAPILDLPKGLKISMF